MLAPEHRERSRKIRVQIPQADNRKGRPGSRGGPSAHMGSMESQQLTLGGLLEALDAVPNDAQLYVAFGSAKRLGGFVRRHRPYVDGIALEPRLRETEFTATAGAFAALLRRAAFGLSWSTEDRPVDGFLSGWDTPVWVSTRHELSFEAVTGVEVVKDCAIIRTTNLAPVQGPTIQRISDEEAINRMRVEYLRRTGQDTVFAPAAERQLLRMAVNDRSDLLHRLDEAREELASFENSLQAKKDRVARLEEDVVRNEYLLGIRDDLPGDEPGCNGLCHRASDVGVYAPGDPVAYAHDSCPEHG